MDLYLSNIYIYIEREREREWSEGRRSGRGPGPGPGSRVRSGNGPRIRLSRYKRTKCPNSGRGDVDTRSVLHG